MRVHSRKIDGRGKIDMYTSDSLPYLSIVSYLSTVVHMTRIIVREKCCLAAYSTYLTSK